MTPFYSTLAFVMCHKGNLFNNSKMIPKYRNGSIIATGETKLISLNLFGIKIAH